jgi:hypothetical protein
VFEDRTDGDDGLSGSRWPDDENTAAVTGTCAYLLRVEGSSVLGRNESAPGASDDGAAWCRAFDDERSKIDSCCFAWPRRGTESFLAVLTDLAPITEQADGEDDQRACNRPDEDGCDPERQRSGE